MILVFVKILLKQNDFGITVITTGVATLNFVSFLIGYINDNIAPLKIRLIGLIFQIICYTSLALVTFQNSFTYLMIIFSITNGIACNMVVFEGATNIPTQTFPKIEATIRTGVSGMMTSGALVPFLARKVIIGGFGHQKFGILMVILNLVVYGGRTLLFYCDHSLSRWAKNLRNQEIESNVNDDESKSLKQNSTDIEQNESNNIQNSKTKSVLFQTITSNLFWFQMLWILCLSLPYFTLVNSIPDWFKEKGHSENLTTFLTNSGWFHSYQFFVAFLIGCLVDYLAKFKNMNTALAICTGLVSIHGILASLLAVIKCFCSVQKR